MNIQPRLNININYFIIFIAIIMLNSCMQTKELPVVKNLDIKKYSGKWYEIARLPNKFEEGLKCVTANYTIKENGKVIVENRGVYINDSTKTDYAKGIAWQPNSDTPAKLKVRFFWPFSGNYWVLEIDSDYTYVLIGEPKRKYMWILSRSSKLDDKIYNMLLVKARHLGFDTDMLIKTEHDCEL